MEEQECEEFKCICGSISFKDIDLDITDINEPILICAECGISYKFINSGIDEDTEILIKKNDTDRWEIDERFLFDEDGE